MHEWGDKKNHVYKKIEGLIEAKGTSDKQFLPVIFYLPQRRIRMRTDTMETHFWLHFACQLKFNACMHVVQK